MKYRDIVFIRGDEAAEPLDLLYNRESPDSVCYHGPTAESVDAAFMYLRQWDYGKPGETRSYAASGTQDDTWEQNGYRMTASLRLGYIGLESIVGKA